MRSPWGCRGAETSVAFSRYWLGAELPQGAEMPLAGCPAAHRSWVGRGRSNQAAQLPGSAPTFNGNLLPARQKGALLLYLEGSQKPLFLSSPRPLPLSPGLGQAMAHEQKGAFVCLLHGAGHCGDS